MKRRRMEKYNTNHNPLNLNEYVRLLDWINWAEEFMKDCKNGEDRCKPSLC